MLVNKPSDRLDAGETPLFARMAEYVMSRLFDVKHKELLALSLFPLNTEAGSGNVSITWRQYDAYGMAKFIANYASDFPRADVAGRENTIKIRSIGQAYGWSIQEIRTAIASGVRLDFAKARKAKEFIDQFIDRVAWLGDASHGVQGFIGYPGNTEYTLLADGSGGSKTWITKTPDQILRDVNKLVAAVVTTTNNIEKPDTLLLPLDQYQYAATTFRSSTSDLTILDAILKTSPYIKQIVPVPELQGAGYGAVNGEGGLARMYVYKKDPTCLELHVPVPFEQFAPQLKNMEQVVNCHARMAGLVEYFPLSVAFADGL